MTMESLCELLMAQGDPEAVLGDSSSSDSGSSQDPSDSSSDGTELSERDSDSQASHSSDSSDDDKESDESDVEAAVVQQEAPARRCLTCYDRILDANWSRHVTCRRHTRMQQYQGGEPGWVRQLPKPVSEPAHEVPFQSLFALETIANVSTPADAVPAHLYG